ncbi:MAG: heavy-metal-associated domain-containing protein [Pasteurellaceae bacterium]|nr:heavy-metal-associated domain-containing protein [Pasteurellaceae bacterium]
MGMSLSYADPLPIGQKSVTLYVKEMTCQLCVYLVNKELRAIDGVISTKADMNAHLVNVVVKENVNNDDLIHSVEKLHYSATIQSF